MAHTWSETQPAGDADKNWYTSAMSDDGSKIVAGAYGRRLYLSTDSGTSWAEVQPAGEADKNWRVSAMSDDGSVILAGVYNGRLYLGEDTSQTLTLTCPMPVFFSSDPYRQRNSDCLPAPSCKPLVSAACGG